MTTLTVGADDWTSLGQTPTDGLFNFQFVNPVLDSATGRVTTTQAWPLRLGVDGTGSIGLPVVPAGNALKVTSLVEGFKGVWYVTVPNVATVTLVDLLTNYQVDPVNLAPLPSAPPVAVAIAAAQAAAIAASEPVGLSDATQAELSATIGGAVTAEQKRADVVYATYEGRSMSASPRLAQPQPQMPAVTWATDSSEPTGMQKSSLLTLSGPTVVLNSPLCARLVNVVSANSSINQTQWLLTNGTNGTATGAPLVTEFTTGTDKLVIGLVSVTDNAFAAPGALEIWIDDTPLSVPAGPSGLAASNGRTLTLAWPGKAPRKVTISSYLLSQNNFWVSSGDTMTPTVAPNAIKLAVLGDSWVEGTAFGARSFARLLPRYLGVDEIPVAGQGGTGYTAAGPAGQGKSVFGSVDRLSAIVRHAPTDLVLFGSINDNSATGATIQAAVSAALAYLATNLPSARIYVVLPQYPNSTSDTSTTQATNVAAVRSAALAAPNVTAIIDTFGWLTGTGWSSVRTGDGNRDLYIGPDSVHPTQAGHFYLAEKLASEIQRWVHA